MKSRFQYQKQASGANREVIYQYQSAAGADPPIFVEILLLSATK
jgi:hypothetical protein